MAYRLRGTVTGASTGSVTLALPSGTAVGDFLLLACESNGSEPVTAPSGWAELPDSPLVVGTTTRLSVFWKVASSAEPSVVVPDPGNHVAAALLVIAGVDALSPVRFSTGDIETTNTTTVQWPAIPEEEIEGGDYAVLLTAWGTDSNTASFDSLILGGLEALDQSSVSTNTGGGGGLGWAIAASPAGEEATAQATLTSTSPHARLVLVLRPDGDPKSYVYEAEAAIVASNASPLQSIVTEIEAAVVASRDVASKALVTEIEAVLVVSLMQDIPAHQVRRRRCFVRFVPG